MTTSNTSVPHPHKSGFLTLIGLPNAGKSSLLNRLVGESLAIISPKAQTTRVNLRGYVLTPELKVVVTDTPGLQEGTKALNQALSRSALRAVKTAASTPGEIVALVVDAADIARSLRLSIPTGLEVLPSLVKRDCGVDLLSTPVIPVLNKADLIRPAEKEKIAQAVSDLAAQVFTTCHPPVWIDTRSETGTETLLSALNSILPAIDEKLFEDDVISDRPLRDFAAEFVREQCFLKLDQELPYAIAVEIEDFSEANPKMVRVQAAIHVERESQKAIVIGTKGAKIKEIGTAARERLEAFIGRRAFLGLKVKVSPQWSKEQKLVERFGYGSDQQ